MKHIEFAQGHFFLDDLQAVLKQRKDSGAQISGKELEFTYDLGDNMKIDIDKAKEKKKEKELTAQKEFESLKKKIEEEKTASPSAQIERSIKFTSGKQAEVLAQKKYSQKHVQGFDDEEPEEIEDFYEDLTTEKLQKASAEPRAAQPITTVFVDEDIDLDYSQTHLDDFLKTHGQNTMIKGSQLMNTFLSSYSKMKSGTTGPSIMISG